MPDDYGKHECLHMSLFLGEAVEKQLMEHAEIKNNPEWFALAEKANQTLLDLYQAIGAVHIT